MLATRASLVALTVLAGLAVVQAAGGIKGAARAEGQPRFQAIKGPVARPPVQPQQQYLPPPPPPPPAALPPPPPPQAPAPIALPPPQQAAIKGPGQVAPVFTAARVQPIVQQQQQQQPIFQQQQQQEQEPEPAQQQQQQQEPEADANQAAQDSAAALAAPALAAPASAAPASAGAEEEANPRPEPYAFNYAFNAGDSATAGSSAREEQQDASGRVTGFYTLKGEDGRDRRVDYVADASGFRATISTNELGTAPKDSADVDWNAQAPSDAQVRVAEAATQAARQRAIEIPQPKPASNGAGAASTSSGLASKFSSPRHHAAAAGSSSSQHQHQQHQQHQQQQQWAAASSANGASLSKVGPQQQIAQLQEPFEQIRQTELNTRARKSRHAPFYLFTI